MVKLDSASMICIPFFSFDSESKPTSNSEDFTSATNDFFEQHSVVICHNLLWNSHHFLVSFFVFPLSLFVFGL
jgi:hypothetical protein